MIIDSNKIIKKLKELDETEKFDFFCDRLKTRQYRVEGRLRLHGVPYAAAYIVDFDKSGDARFDLQMQAIFDYFDESYKKLVNKS